MSILGTCRECGAVAGLVNNLCRNCIEARHEAFTVSRNYFRDNRGATAHRCSEDTGVSLTLLMEWIGEGRLRVATGDEGSGNGDAREQARLADLRQAFAERAQATAPTPQTATAPPQRQGMHRRDS